MGDLKFYLHLFKIIIPLRISLNKSLNGCYQISNILPSKNDKQKFKLQMCIPRKNFV